MEREELERVLARFARAARRHDQALQDLDEAAAARQAAMLGTLAVNLRTLGASGVAGLVRLANGDDPVVAGMAACYLLPQAPAEALPILQRLAAGEGLLAFRASVLLERWQRGELA